MDKFVVSLPRGNGHKRKNSSTNLGSASKKLALKRVGEAHRSITVSPVPKPQQMFLDLGQKTFGATEQCLMCNMFFIKGDLEDEKRHKAFCTQFNKNPTIQGVIEDKYVVETIYDNCKGNEFKCQMQGTPAEGSRPEENEDSGGVLAPRIRCGSRRIRKYT